MIIQSDNVQMTGRRSYQQGRYSYSTTTLSGGNAAKPQTDSFWSSQGFSLWGGAGAGAQGAAAFPQMKQQQENAKTDAEDAPEGVEAVEDALSGEENRKKNPWEALMLQFPATQNVQSSVLQERLEAIQQMRRQTLDYLMHILFGRTQKGGQDFSFLNEGGVNPGVGTQTMRRTTYFTYHENETTSFSAKGTAVTADGRSIEFDIGLTMSRAFTQTASSFVDFNQPLLCDPLVINLNSNVATVSDQKFFFDLDADGEEEEISRLNSGSGYLALDKNGDGVINDGTELFGTKSGNGFADLMEYDEDGNGWIDEADSIFQKLKIWMMDENGESKLLNLKDAGVGAMYLGSKDTEFSLKDSENNVNAVIRKTGLFLYENGGSGTMQQLDLAT